MDARGARPPTAYTLIRDAAWQLSSDAAKPRTRRNRKEPSAAVTRRGRAEHRSRRAATPTVKLPCLPAMRRLARRHCGAAGTSEYSPSRKKSL
ncbi:hypothetical protein E2C01_055547 [Portunus trituberculatus]|uniref:Uncharacterized protein n=1 Tax=Portunus trituberculatus TaxID=210409 RepID=A0A5B7GVT2_PORTR|nr:hypothetical protein [Portunus trituberculatus]